MVKEPENNGIAASSPNANDSWDLDLTYKPKSKSNLGNEGPETGAEFIPGKGQKMAAKRLKKIGGLFVSFASYEITLKSSVKYQQIYVFDKCFDYRYIGKRSS